MIENSNPTPEQPWSRRYAIVLRPEQPSSNDGQDSKPKMIGLIGCPREAEIGYKLLEAVWGKGYMTEAIQLFVDMWWKMPGSKPTINLNLSIADPE